MPIIGVTASSINLGGGYWGAVLNTSSAQTQYGSIFIDKSSKACYQVYTAGFGVTPQASIVKLKSNGSFDWQRTYSVSLPSGNAIGGGGVDSSGNVYFAGQQNSSPNNKGFLLKTDSSGTLSVQKRWNDGGTGSVLARAMILNPSGAQILMCSTDGNGTLNPQLNLFDTSYNQGWTSYWAGSGNQNQNCVLMDDQARMSTWASSPQYMLNANNTLRWAVTSGDYFNGSGCTNLNGQLFLIPPSGGSGSEVARVSETNGTLTWAKRLSDASATRDNVGVTANNSYVYNLFYGAGGGVGTIYISKRNVSNGSLVWQRQITQSNGGYQDLRAYYAYYTNGQTIAVDSTDTSFYISFYITGIANEQAIQYIWKLPADGSKTGTYALNGLNFTYSASSLTDSSFTPTRTTTTATITNSSVTQVNGVGTVSASQLVSTAKVVVP